MINGPQIPITQPYSTKEGILTEQKLPKEIRPFDGVGTHYRQWAIRVRDHCQSINMGWRKILTMTQNEQNRISWARLMDTTIDTLGPAAMIEISQTLWALLGNLMTDAIHPRREAMVGGEEGNGLEL